MKQFIPLYFILTLLLVVGTLLHKKDFERVYEKIDDTVLPNPINLLLSNDLSDLEETKQMEKYVENFLRQWEITGASLAVMKNGKLLYSKGFGYADKEMGVETDVKHIFRIASVSKLITAVAVMRLAEEGLLGLNDKVFGEEGILCDSLYLAAITDRRVKNITVDHLLRHRAGYTLRAGDPVFSPLDVAARMKFPLPITTENLVQYAAASRLATNPGNSNIYSNLGYVVLGKIIEKVSGMNYEDYVQEKVLHPAGCYDMHMGHIYYSEKFPNEVRYYEPSDAEPIRPFDGSDGLEPRRYGGNDISLVGAAGGWVASPVEILKLVAAIDPESGTTGILSQKSVTAMTRYAKDVYPIGWIKVTEGGDWLRTGSLAGTSALLKRERDGYTWMFVTNTSSWTGSRFTSKIEAMMKEAIKKVESWPERDMFLTQNAN